MNRSFIIASICGLVLGVLLPALLPFAIAGIFLGVAPVALPWMRRHRWLTIGLAVLVAVMISVILTLTVELNPRFGFQARLSPTITVDATYTGEAIHQDGPERLDIEDRYVIPNSSFLLAAKGIRFYSFDDPAPSARSAGFLHTLARILSTRVTLGLERQGWEPLRPTTEEIAFVRKRQVNLDVPKMPPESPNTIELPSPAGVASVDGMPIDLDLTPASRIELTAPERTFGDSFPAGVKQTRPAQDLEVLSIPRGTDDAVEIDVRSPWFRNEVLAGFAGLTIPGAIRASLGFLFMALIALFNDELKKFLGRIWKRGKKANFATETE